MQERLQKIIARAGKASRRSGEELILAGRVRVNGRVITELGTKADIDQDKVEVDGQRLFAEALQYLVLHKPRNVVSTLDDPEDRPTVASLLQTAGARIYPVGRLDFATSGVLLATNDGDFANALLHPKKGVPKTYVAKVNGHMSDADLERWRTGIELEDGRTLPALARRLRYDGDKTWIELTLREGRNQQIRRMGEATGFPVMRLARVSFAGVTHEGLRPGQWRPLTYDELTMLRKEFGVPKKLRAAPGGPARGNVFRESVAIASSSRQHADSAHRLRPQGRRTNASDGWEPRDDRGARPTSPNPNASGRGRTAPSTRTHDARPSRDAQPQRESRGRSDRNARPEGAPVKKHGRTERVKSERNDRSGTTPRGAERPASRARGPADRSTRRARS